MAEHFDLLIRGGTLVDGTGAPARRGDVAIRDGRIVALGTVPGAARRVLDAEGAAVAPGFVDIHTHYDAQVFWDRMLTISPWLGVTSVVMGNCGFGVAPTRPAHRDLMLRTLEKVEGMSLDALRAGIGADWPFETFGEFLGAIERRGTAINVGALVGHTPVRLYVMGEEAPARQLDRTPRRHARARRPPRRPRAIGRHAGQRRPGDPAGVLPAAHGRVQPRGALPARAHVGHEAGVPRRRRRQARDLRRPRVPPGAPREDRRRAARRGVPDDADHRAPARPLARGAAARRRRRGTRRPSRRPGARPLARLGARDAFSAGGAQHGPGGRRRAAA